MGFLTEVLTPVFLCREVIPTENTPKSTEYEPCIRDALLGSVNDNSEYHKDVLKCWAMCYLYNRSGDEAIDAETPIHILCDMTDAMLAFAARMITTNRYERYLVGGILCTLAQRRIKEKYTFTDLPVATPIQNDRLAMMVTLDAEQCRYTKYGDRHLHTKMMLHLPAYDIAAIGSNPEVVHDYMNVAYDKRTTINIVRPLFNQLAGTIAEGINYESLDPQQLAIVVGILAETITSVNPHMRINNHILREPIEGPHIFAFRGFGGLSDCIGVVHNNNIYRADTVPIASILLYWATHTNDADELRTALTCPESLPQSSRYWSMFNTNR